MSADESLFPRKWLLLAAIASVVLAAALAWLIFAPRAMRPSLGPEGSALRLEQRDEQGLAVAWGTTLPADQVELEVVGLDPSKTATVDLRLTRDESPPESIRQMHGKASLQKLEPGRYRWLATVEFRDGERQVLEPPRGDPLAADFVVVSRALALPSLWQRMLDGAEIGEDRRTRGGATLGVQLDGPLPGAVLEVEVKKVGGAETKLQRLPVNDGIVAAQFVGPDGAYTWRARLVASSTRSTEWRNFGDGMDGDFHIYGAGESERPNEENKGKEDSAVADSGGGDRGDSSGAGGGAGPGGGGGGGDATGGSAGGGSGDSGSRGENQAAGKRDKSKADSKLGGDRDGPFSNAYSSGMGSGHREPLPSRVRPLPSLWHLALYRVVLVFGGLIAILGVLLAGIKIARRFSRRSS